MDWTAASLSPLRREMEMERFCSVVIVCRASGRRISWRPKMAIGMESRVTQNMVRPLVRILWMVGWSCMLSQ